MAVLSGNTTKTRSITVYSDHATNLIANFEYGFRHSINTDNSYTISNSSFTPNTITRHGFYPSLISRISGTPTSSTASSAAHFDQYRNLTVGYSLREPDPSRELDSRTNKLYPRYTLLYGNTVLGYWQPAASGNYISGSDVIYEITPSATPKSVDWCELEQQGIAIGVFNGNIIKTEASNRIYYFSGAISTSTLFNTSNKTAKTVTLTVSASLYATMTGLSLEYLREVGIHLEGTIPYEDSHWDDQTYSFSFSSGYNTGFSGNIGSITVTLDAPPTFSASGLTFTKNYRRSDAGVYRGYTSVSVDISNLSAKYGGDITSVVFKVANKTVSGTSNGTYTINLDDNTSLGTYTPTVTVTDSRGQVTTQSLEAFTILDYSAPSITAASVVRTDSTGAPVDEDNYALITTTIGWQDFLEALEEPTVTYVDENGQAQTASVTWYTDSALQNPVTDWTALTSPVTLYGLTGGLSYLYAYPITVTPEDTRTTGNPATVVLPPAFYTMDFRAGGHGIAIGAPAITDEFYIAMDTTINMDTDFCLELDTNASSGADHDIIAAINSLGWTDVLKN